MRALAILIIVVLGVLAEISNGIEDVTTVNFTSIDLGHFRGHVYPSDDCSKHFSSYEARSITEENDGIAWGDSNTSIVAIGNSLFINDHHYLIPENTKTVWILENEVFVPGRGLIPKVPIPDKLAKQIKEASEDTYAQFFGIVFGLKNYYMLGSSSNGADKNNFDVSMGPYVFSVKNSRLIFRNKDYGLISEGDHVVLDDKKILTIQHAPSSSK